MGVAVHPTAYGAAAYEVLRSVVAEAKADDPLAVVTLLVPSNLTGTVARRELAATLRRPGSAGPGVAGLLVLTLPRLAELIAAAHLVAGGRRPLTAPVLAAAWQRELAGDAGCFTGVAAHPATVTALVEAYRVLRDVPDVQLDPVAGHDALRADLVSLVRRVSARLAPGYYDEVDLYAEAVAVLRAGGPEAGRLGTVVAFLPQESPPGARRLLAALGEVAPTAVVAGFSGSARADVGVLRELAALGVEQVAPTSSVEPVAHRVLHASDSDDEVRCVARLVVSALQSSPASRVAVLHPVGGGYARLLHEHLATVGVTVNGPGVRPAAERVVPRALLQVLALPDAGFSRAAVLDLLSGAPVRDVDGRPVPAATWERLSREAGVVTGADWPERLPRLARGLLARADASQGSDDHPSPSGDRLARDAEAAQRLAGFVAGLQAELAEAEGLTSWGELAGWVQRLVPRLFGPAQQRYRLPEEERSAAERLEGYLTTLDSLDDVAPGAAGLPALRHLLELQFAQDRQRVGRYGTGVLVAPVTAAVGLVHEEVFVLGLAEDLCPGRPADDALLPDEIRERVAGGLPTARDRVQVQHRMLLAAFAAGARVTASFPRGDLRRSSDRLPSRWLLPTLRTLTGQPRLSAGAWQQGAAGVATVLASPTYASSVLGLASIDEPATEQEWRQRAIWPGRSEVAPDDPVLARAVEVAQAHDSPRFTRFDGNLAAVRELLPDPADGRLIVSATQLERWVACPHAYFVERLLRVEPVQAPEERVQLSPLDRGSILHEALDAFFAWLVETDSVPAPDDPWSPAQRARLQELGGRIADDFAARGLGGHPTVWAQDRSRLLDDLDQFLAEDESVRATERRVQLRSELHFGREPWPAPVEVRLPDGRVVRLRGSADRLDRVTDGTLVVSDYKSGSATSFQPIAAGADPTVAGTKLQLPVYAHAARLRTHRPDAPVRAEYWFIGPKDRGRRIPLAFTPAVEARHGEVLAVIADGIASGVFPANAPEDSPWASWSACGYCDPDGLGARRRRVQWQRKRSDPQLAAYVRLVEPDEEPGPRAAPAARS